MPNEPPSLARGALPLDVMEIQTPASTPAFTVLDTGYPAPGLMQAKKRGPEQALSVNTNVS